MFVVSNRNVVPDATGTDVFGPRVNELGPAELRIAEAQRVAGEWQVQLLPDLITDSMKQEVGLHEAGDVLVSRYVFRRLLAIANPQAVDPASPEEGKDILLFVHGFNNSFGDVLERCAGLAETYGMEVVAFSWPANGGGLKGTADYLDDKRDAQASVVAFDRVLALAGDMIAEAQQAFLTRLTGEVRKRFPDNGERQREMLAREAERRCPFRVSLLAHSMGNYLLERTLKSSALRGAQLVFDNLVMCAADVNNPGHAEWVDQIQVRNRLYVTINESDYALRASRMKGGSEQLARLGHYPFGLDARQAIYVDFTAAPQVGSSHAYFEGGAVENPRVKAFFQRALHGRRVEDEGLLAYDAARNLHRLA